MASTGKHWKLSDETKAKMSKSRIGIKYSPETLKRMSESKKGRIPWNKGKKSSEETKKKISESKKGKLSWMKGKKHTEESKKKNSLAHIGKANVSKGIKRPHMTGINNWKWVVDRSLLKDDHKDRAGQLHREWSKAVKNRDGWKCKMSNGDCSGQVVAHHILSWKDHEKLRYEVNNGITLCHFHHPRKRNDEIKLSPYFQELVKTK